MKVEDLAQVSAFAKYKENGSKNKSQKVSNAGIVKKSKKQLKKQQLKKALQQKKNKDIAEKEPKVQVTPKNSSSKEVKQNKKSKKKPVKQIIEVEDSDDEEIPQLIEPFIEVEEATPETDLSGFLKQTPNISFPKKTETLLKWLLHPILPKDFFEDYWEESPLYIKHNNEKYFSQILTSSDIDLMLREHPLYFSRNVDMVIYKDGSRITENPVGRARASIVWDAYAAGYSIRILNPQTYNIKVQLLLSTLQEYFGTMVGANVYLTPAGSQGFAPHYDDIEAFVIQLEGRKHWKLYKPVNDDSNLARFSSNDFKREELGEPLIEVTLNAGDLLYFPRGVVHEAKTDDEMHSLHVTLSTYQRTAYADLLEELLPQALQRAAANNIEYRKGLPIGYLKHMGAFNSDNSEVRQQIEKNVCKLIKMLPTYACTPTAVDKLGRKFMHDAVPPVLDLQEKECSSMYDGDKLYKGRLVERAEITPDTEIRILRYYAVRLVVENQEVNLYYCTENSKVYHEEEQQYITIDADMIPIVVDLIKSYPKFLPVENLPCDDMEKKMSFITTLWDYGIIVTNERLEINEDDDITDTDSSDD
ncbi:PREDICTED: bifunctional lysine-specific demethylase and histidyl-hydroxylase NO66 [Nicrophorus vespilloides]|uniref:Bifunctional lysine-specific demethylase and histidyl-hydroxylase n=1 Tax=Nicrophorus vespilloides TaxID=110193 RepID=A0ABM1N8U1_NICVS|nr:PREDICTED: bifunctional lysine-specific demethylase and histidyl-hydroxylase NO66 [Nicrophorus vespilloides]